MDLASAAFGLALLLVLACVILPGHPDGEPDSRHVRDGPGTALSLSRTNARDGKVVLDDRQIASWGLVVAPRVHALQAASTRPEPTRRTPTGQPPPGPPTAHQSLESL